MSDLRLRNIERAHGKGSEQWFREKLRVGQLSRSMQIILYELQHPPIRAILGPGHHTWIEGNLHSLYKFLCKKRWTQECLVKAYVFSYLDFITTHREKLVRVVLNRL